ncbi:MAG: cytochrome c3 family protein [Myxococcaceae bacterium]
MKNKAFHKPWVLLVAASFTVACATLATRLGPDLADRLKIPHAKHQEAGVECDACHEKVATAKSLAESLIPPMDKCGECHDVADDKACGMCHTHPDEPAARERVNLHLNFPHDKHLANPDIKGECARCHKALPEPERTAPIAGPPMALCLECHNHAKDYDEGRCSLCHQELNRFPLRPVSDFSHRGDFVREHALSARSTVVCAQCHEQTFCTDCHAKTVAAKVEVKFPERVDRVFIHRNDFVSRHQIEARADEARCQRCHGVSFCQSCHALQGLTPQGVTSVNPHPQGFVGPGPGSHAVEARRDIVRCAACHDQGASSICVDCHRVGGVGGNPHPASWLSRHNRDELRKNSMCLACHP